MSIFNSTIRKEFNWKADELRLKDEVCPLNMKSTIGGLFYCPSFGVQTNFTIYNGICKAAVTDYFLYRIKKKIHVQSSSFKIRNKK